jgi:hypothetical protein
MNTPTLPIKLRECATRVVNHCFNKPGDSALMSIPASRERDADLLLNEAADEVERLQRERAELVELLRQIHEATNKVYQMGDAAARRTLVGVYEISGKVLSLATAK